MFLIYLPSITPRCGYVFDMVFKQEFGFDYRLTTDLITFEAYEKEKINYSSRPLKNEFFIQASPFLFSESIEAINIGAAAKHGTTVLFPSSEFCVLGFDVFSAVFYMVSRYEEYLPFTPDKYGRFPFSGSLACKLGFLEKPVVNIWLEVLKKALQKRFVNLACKSSLFNFISTYDIDTAYAFKGRKTFRLIRSTILDAVTLRLKNILSRYRTITGNLKDPWDVYDQLAETITGNRLHAIFFFLVSDYTRHDKNVSASHPEMKTLIQKISGFSDIGIHPSFKSSNVPGRIAMEIERLQNVYGEKVTKSRQHYLKFSLPSTYNELIDAGIREDYSMGFAGMPGFRAGTCKPFYFYDLQKEQITGLKLFPITMMEGTFIDYLHESPAEALNHIFTLIDEVKNVHGTFISIWHNHTLSDINEYRGWKYVHDQVIARIVSHL